MGCLVFHAPPLDCFINHFIVDGALLSPITMFTKHFFKMVVTFIGMIILGLIGVFIVGNLGERDQQNTAGMPACESEKIC